MYIDKLNDIVNEYFNTYNRAINLNLKEQLKALSLLMLKIIHILTPAKTLMINIPNFKLVIM